MHQCNIVHVSVVCAHYTPHTYAVLQLLCDRFIFGFLFSWRLNFACILISIVIIDNEDPFVYNHLLHSSLSGIIVL